MRIGIEAQRVFRLKKGGMDVVVLHLILQLQKMNLPHEFFLFVKKGEDSSWLPTKSNFQIIYVEGENYAYWEQVQLPKIIKNYALDIIHFTSNTAPLFLNHSKKILTLHDIMFLERGVNTSFKGTLYQILGNFYRKLIVPQVVKKMDKIITVSHSEKELIMKYFSNIQDKIITVHNGVSHSKFRYTENLSQKYKLPMNYFFHLGNTEPRKNTEGLLKAFNQYKKQGGMYDLVINGIESGQLQHLLKKHNLLVSQTYIISVGDLSYEELNTIYKTSKGLIYPSFREGFGLPPLEAMLHQVPVIVSNQASIQEICGEAAYYVDPYNIKEIMNALFAFEDEKLRIEYIEKGNKQVQKYSWKKMTEEVLAIYESMN